VGTLCDVGAYELELDTLSTDEAEVTPIPTREPGGPSTVIITTDTLCLTGPSASSYAVINTLTKGLVGQLIGAGETGNGNQGWLVMTHPNFADTTCWVDANYAEPSIPFSEMRLIFVPLAPTATPKATREPGPAATNVPPPPSPCQPNDPAPKCN